MGTATTWRPCLIRRWQRWPSGCVACRTLPMSSSPCAPPAEGGRPMGDGDGRPWGEAELRAAKRLAGPGGRSLWSRGADRDASSRLGAEAELSRPGPAELVVHLEGRNGVAYLDGRPVPTEALAAVMAELPVTFSLVVLLICHAGQGELVRRLRAGLASRGRPLVRLWATRDVAAVSAATGTAVALTMVAGTDGVLRPATLSTFEESSDQTAHPAPVGPTVPANIDVATDPGPFTPRMLPGPAALGPRRSEPWLDRWARGLVPGSYEVAPIAGGVWVRPRGERARAVAAVLEGLPAAGARPPVGGGPPGAARG